jgi:hypothetical protein
MKHLAQVVSLSPTKQLLTNAVTSVAFDNGARSRRDYPRPLLRGKRFRVRQALPGEPISAQWQFPLPESVNVPPGTGMNCHE